MPPCFMCVIEQLKRNTKSSLNYSTTYTLWAIYRSVRLKADIFYHCILNIHQVYEYQRVPFDKNTIFFLRQFRYEWQNCTMCICQVRNHAIRKYDCWGEEGKYSKASVDGIGTFFQYLHCEKYIFELTEICSNLIIFN